MTRQGLIGCFAYFMLGSTPIATLGDPWIPMVTNLGALGLLAALLMWNKDAEKKRTAEVKRVIDNKDILIAGKDQQILDLIKDFTALVRADIDTRHQLASELRTRPCLTEHNVNKIELGDTETTTRRVTHEEVGK